MDAELEAIIAADTKRTNLRKAISHAIRAGEQLRAAQYSITMGQVEGQTLAMDARGAVAKLLDSLETQLRDMEDGIERGDLS